MFCIEPFRCSGSQKLCQFRTVADRKITKKGTQGSRVLVFTVHRAICVSIGGSTKTQTAKL